MMWPLRRKPKDEESKKALSEAQDNLLRIQKRTSEVRRVTTAQKNLLERNQFVERLGVIMGGHR